MTNEEKATKVVDLKAKEGEVEELKDTVNEETELTEVETKGKLKALWDKTKKAVSDHKVAIAVTAVGIVAGGLAMKSKSNKDADDDIIEGDFEELDTFDYDEGYSEPEQEEEVKEAEEAE